MEPDRLGAPFLRHVVSALDIPPIVLIKFYNHVHITTYNFLMIRIVLSLTSRSQPFLFKKNKTSSLGNRYDYTEAPAYVGVWAGADTV